jgi:hypothetical protein
VEPDARVLFEEYVNQGCLMGLQVMWQAEENLGQTSKPPRVVILSVELSKSQLLHCNFRCIQIWIELHLIPHLVDQGRATRERSTRWTALPSWEFQTR